MRACVNAARSVLACAARGGSGAVPVGFLVLIHFCFGVLARVSPRVSRFAVPRAGSALLVDVAARVYRAGMASLVGASLLGKRCSLWRSACRPLMLAAMGQPRVTQDASRNGQVTIEPADAARHTATFIGPIHGLGDTNQGWLGAAMHLHTQMPHVKFVLPNAPTMPVTLNMGMPMPSWYDITSLDDRASQPCTGIEESRAVVDALIAEELAAGTPLDRIVVGGFSQGGALALFSGLQYPGRLAGVCCLSGYLAKAEAFVLSPEAAATPVAHFHGTLDPTVQIAWARESAARLRALGCTDYTLKEYAHLGHSVDPEEIEDLQAWLEGVLPPL